MKTEWCEMFGGPEDGRRMRRERYAPVEFPVVRNLQMELKPGAEFPTLKENPLEVVRYRFSGEVRRDGTCLFFEVGRHILPE